jgi:hypothetical protein
MMLYVHTTIHQDNEFHYLVIVIKVTKMDGLNIG